jgi:hypothetical protein
MLQMNCRDSSVATQGAGRDGAVINKTDGNSQCGDPGANAPDRALP